MLCKLRGLATERPNPRPIPKMRNGTRWRIGVLVVSFAISLGGAAAAGDEATRVTAFHVEGMT